MENPFDDQNPPQENQYNPGTNPFPPPGNQFPPPGNQYYPPGNQYPPQGPPPHYWQQNQFPPPEKPRQTALDLWKVVGINFGVFLLYQAFLALFGSDGFLILDMFPLIAHWATMLILMIIAFSRGKKMYGLGHLISLILIIIIGFGSCFMIAEMVGSGFNVH